MNSPACDEGCPNWGSSTTLSPATPFTQVSSACQPANEASPTPLSLNLSPQELGAHCRRRRSSSSHETAAEQGSLQCSGAVDLDHPPLTCKHTHIPCHTIPYHTIPYHTIPYHIIPYTPYHAMPCHAMPIHAMTCHATPCHAMPCHAMPCHAMPCHAMPCHAIPYHTMLYPVPLPLP